MVLLLYALLWPDVLLVAAIAGSFHNPVRGPAGIASCAARKFSGILLSARRKTLCSRGKSGEPVIAVLQLMYPESSMPSGFFLKKKPPCTKLLRTRELESCSKRTMRLHTGSRPRDRRSARVERSISSAAVRKARRRTEKDWLGVITVRATESGK
jgi:hypothetical protein